MPFELTMYSSAPTSRIHNIIIKLKQTRELYQIVESITKRMTFGRSFPSSRFMFPFAIFFLILISRCCSSHFAKQRNFPFVHYLLIASYLFFTLQYTFLLIESKHKSIIDHRINYENKQNNKIKWIANRSEWERERESEYIQYVYTYRLNGAQKYDESLSPSHFLVPFRFIVTISNSHGPCTKKGFNMICMKLIFLQRSSVHFLLIRSYVHFIPLALLAVLK